MNKKYFIHKWKSNGFSGNPDRPKWWRKCELCGDEVYTYDHNESRNFIGLTGLSILIIFATLFFLMMLFSYLYINRII